MHGREFTVARRRRVMQVDETGQLRPYTSQARTSLQLLACTKKLVFRDAPMLLH
jgi:hypothetical protein